MTSFYFPTDRPPRQFEQEWSVLNFKSIDHACLKLSPLSIVAGANSAGKSSLIQSLLLLSQSAQEGQMVLNGSLVSLGEAHDVIRRGQKELTLSLARDVPRFLAETRGERVPVRIDLHLGVVAGEMEVNGLTLEAGGRILVDANRSAAGTRAHRSIAPRGRSGYPGRITTVSTALQLHFVEASKRMPLTLVEINGLIPEMIYSRRSIRQRRRELAELVGEASTRFAAFRELTSLVSRGVSEQGAPEGLQGFLELLQSDPRNTRDRGSDSQVYELDDEIYKYLVEGSWLEWEAESLGRRGVARQQTDSVANRDPAVAEAMHYLSLASLGLTELGSSITYLGPLRDEPRVVSPMGRGSRSLPVGSRGEYTADFLVRRRARPISYVSPSGKPVQRSLIEAVSEWIEFLGIGTRISVSNRGKLGLTLRLELEGVERDLTTVGVGASQLLPVVVALLGAEMGAVVLLEQPELHLHPAVQSRLGEFLVTARPDLRVVVETHSENLLTRIRLRVVQGRVNAERVCILFGEQDAGVTSFRRLELNSFGDLNEWPKGFFDEGDSDSGAIVMELARRAGRASGDTDS